MLYWKNEAYHMGFITQMKDEQLCASVCKQIQYMSRHVLIDQYDSNETELE